MSIKSKIYLYQTLTVLFALLTIVSLGNIVNENIFSTVTRSGLFIMLTRECYIKECTLEYYIFRKRNSKIIKMNNQKEKVA